MPVEEFHHPGEVEQAAAQAIDFVHQDAVDLAGLNVGQQSSERRSIHVAAGKSPVVIPIGLSTPSLRRPDCGHTLPPIRAGRRAC